MLRLSWGTPVEKDAHVSQRAASLRSAHVSQRAASLGSEPQLQLHFVKQDISIIFLVGLESNPGSSLQTEEEAGLP